MSCLTFAIILGCMAGSINSQTRLLEAILGGPVIYRQECMYVYGSIDACMHM